MKILFKLLFSSFYLQQVAARILDQRKLSRTLHELQKANLDIKIIYDIGARYGKWSKAIAKIFTYLKRLISAFLNLINKNFNFLSQSYHQKKRLLASMNLILQAILITKKIQPTITIAQF